MSKRDFDKLLLEAVDEGLSSIGESSKHAVYYHLEKGFNLKRNEIPSRIAEFEAAIEKIFGLGANFLEILIMKRLYEKIGRAVQLHGAKDFAFIVYVAAARRSFIEKKNAEEWVQCEKMVIKR